MLLVHGVTSIANAFMRVTNTCLKHELANSTHKDQVTQLRNAEEHRFVVIVNHDVIEIKKNQGQN